MTLPMFSLVLLSSLPAWASSPPVIQSVGGGCYWVPEANNFLWWFETWVYDVDGDVNWVSLALESRAGIPMAEISLQGGPVSADWTGSYWYTEFYQEGTDPDLSLQCGLDYFGELWVLDEDINTATWNIEIDGSEE